MFPSVAQCRHLYQFAVHSLYVYIYKFATMIPIFMKPPIFMESWQGFKFNSTFGRYYLPNISKNKPWNHFQFWPNHVIDLLQNLATILSFELHEATEIGHQLKSWNQNFAQERDLCRFIFKNKSFELSYFKEIFEPYICSTDFLLHPHRRWVLAPTAPASPVNPDP